MRIECLSSCGVLNAMGMGGSAGTRALAMASAGSASLGGLVASAGSASLGGLADIWREVQGSNEWKGMLHPTMNPILRRELIRYGDFAQACYDAFDSDVYSKNCGNCKYPRTTFFQCLGMADRGYRVTRYLYATSNINVPSFFKKSRMPQTQAWSKHANWMGYVAVATDENEIRRLGRRDILIAWRGTVTNLEWIADLMDVLRPAGLDSHSDPSVKVESGFLRLYTACEGECPFSKSSARDQVLAEIKRLLHQYEGEELSITITGHSLGSALAMLNAYDLAGLRHGIPITVFSFAGPRVGNSKFRQRCEELGLKMLRVLNVHDKVPKVPGLFVNEHIRWIADKLPWGWSYSHVGVELALDHTRSPFLKPTDDIAYYHNLEAHLHLLDGYHGPARPFSLSSGRDPALVNKSTDFLAYHLLIPPFWRQDENKGLVQDKQGRWVQPDPKIQPQSQSPLPSPRPT